MNNIYFLECDTIGTIPAENCNHTSMEFKTEKSARSFARHIIENNSTLYNYDLDGAKFKVMKGLINEGEMIYNQVENKIKA